MKLTKVFIGFLVVALVLFLGMQSVGAQEVEIEYWNLFTGGDGEFMDELVERFNEEHSDIHVNSTTLEWNDYYTGLLTGVASGEGPHVAISHISRLPDLVNQGILTSLDDDAENVGLSWDEYDQNLTEETIFDGGHYALPLDSHFNVFWYHEPYFEEAGLLDEDGNLDLGNTPEEFMESMKKVIEESDAEYSLTYANSQPDFDLNRTWWGFYNQQQGEIEVSNRTVTMDLEKSTEILDLFSKLRSEEIVPRVNYDEAVNLFQNGRAAASINGVWTAGIFSEVDTIKAAKVPQLFDVPASWGDSHSFVLPYNESATAEEREAAMTFAKYITEQGLYWAQAGHVPSKLDIRELDEFNDLPFRETLNEAVKDVAYENIGEHTWTLRTILTEEIANMLNDDSISPADTSEIIKNQLESEL